MSSGNPLNKHDFYKTFRKTMISNFGRDEAERIWEEAGQDWPGFPTKTLL